MTFKLAHPGAGVFAPENRAESLNQLKILAAQAHGPKKLANIDLFFRLCEELAWVDQDSQDEAFDLYMQWVLLYPEYRGFMLPSREELRKNFGKTAEFCKGKNQGVPWDQRTSAMTAKAVLFPHTCWGNRCDAGPQ